MEIVGRAALLLALAAAVYAIVMALGSRRAGRRAWQLSAERAVYGVLGLTSLAIGTMWAALLTDDFALRNVAGYSSSTLGWQSKLTAGSTYRLNGLVAEGSPRDAAARAQSEEGLRFFLIDKEDHSKRVQVLYRGSVPDTWKDGRELVLTGELRNGVFQAERGSMLALCPSKFTDRPEDTQAST